MVHLAHEEIYRGVFTPPEELVNRVLEVEREQVAGAAARYLEPTRFAVTALGPAAGGPITEADWPLAV
jgi:predicted Zn-dependent peptidase